jgi:uncharacterized MAPEG superfamily protein
MTPELTALALAGLLQALQFAFYSVAGNLQVGPRKALGPRDEPVVLTGKAGRLQRALNNHFEGLILFTLAVTVVSLGDRNTSLTAIAAWTYLGARILYVPAYYFGLSPWRSLIWFTGFLATLALLLSAFI